MIRTLLIASTEPQNDSIWDYVLKLHTRRYLEEPEPWFSPGVAEVIAGELSENMRVFEWGSGASTLWLEGLGCQVVSYETDPEWHRAVAARAGARTDVRLVSAESEEYFPSLYDYDLVIIDAKRRSECGHQVLEQRFKGLVVFDDSHRIDYQDSITNLAAGATKALHFAGISPELTPKMTSLFWL